MIVKNPQQRCISGMTPDHLMYLIMNKPNYDYITLRDFHYLIINKQTGKFCKDRFNLYCRSNNMESIPALTYYFKNIKKNGHKLSANQLKESIRKITKNGSLCFLKTNDSRSRLKKLNVPLKRVSQEGFTSEKNLEAFRNSLIDIRDNELFDFNEIICEKSSPFEEGMNNE